MSDNSGEAQQSGGAQAGQVAAGFALAGCTIASIGVLVGLFWMFDRHPVECADEGFRPMGTECYVHPHLYAGTQLTLVSLLLGILVGLTGAAAKAVLSGGSSAAAAGARRERPVVLRPPRPPRPARPARPARQGRARTVAGRGLVRSG